MAQQILNNGETNLAFRTKLNDNFTELYTTEHDHKNKTVLDKFSESGGKVTFNGQTITGSAGTDGKDGADGEDGKSAYDLWIDVGNSGTIQDFLDAIKGADGEDGKDGADGITAPISGFFSMYVDEDSNLWAVVPKSGSVPLEYDEETGNLYYLIWRGSND